MKLMSARASRAPAPISTENRAPRHARRPLEVEDAERRRRGPSAASARSRTPAARRCRRTSRLSAADAPDGHARVRQVRQRQQQGRALRAPISSSSDLELPDLLRRGPCSPRRVARRPGPGASGARDFVAGGVLLALEPLDLGNQAPALGFERRELLEIGVGIEAARCEARRGRRRGDRGRKRGRAWARS